MSAVRNITGIDVTKISFDAQLRRYNRGYRRRLRKMARSSSRLSDLLYTFPAAAFVIAGHGGNPLARAEAARLVKDGASLRKVGKVLGLPGWTRRLPPETFNEAFGNLPDSDRFNRSIVNLIPDEAGKVAVWFSWLIRADQYCDEDFALWLARQKISFLPDERPDILLPLAAWVWFCRNGKTRARGLIETPWTAQTGFAKAIEATRGWIVRLLLDDCHDSSRQIGRWLVPQKASGYRIIPLRKRDELADEGRLMHNCVADYATAVAAGNCLIYSVRRGNNHVATLEIKPHHAMGGTPVVAQLLGPHNDEVDEAITRAVDGWLKRQGRYPFVHAGNYALAGFDTSRWETLWAPYFEARGKSRSLAGRPRTVQPMLVHSALQELSWYA